MTKNLPTSSKALHIGVVREGRFIEDRWFNGDIHVTVGTAEKNTFPLPLSSLPASQPLFVHKAGKLVLHFDEKARGKLTINKRELELSDCRKEGLAAPHAGYFELPLNDDTRGRITLGEVSFVFNFAAPPPTAPKPVLPKEARGTIWNVTDHTFFTILVVSLALHACAIAAISARDLPPEDAAMEEIPDRFAKLLIPEKPAEEKPKEVEKPKEEVVEEVKEDKKEAKKEEPAKDSAEHKADVQKAVAQKGLVKILGSIGQNGGGALANVLAQGGGFSDDIGAALAGAGGVAIATGADGPARRGEGAAQASGIGGIATSGGGNVKLREKTDVAVHGSVQSEEAEVDSATVDKDALARFIKLRVNSIRGCYEAQLKRSPNLRGKIVVRFTIGTRGQVVEVTIDSDSMGSDEVAACIQRLVKTWRFPFTPESDTPVSFPFIFSPAG